MGKISNIEDYRINLNSEDIFNIFLIYMKDNKDYFDINLETLMLSLGKYLKMPRFKDIYRNLKVRVNEKMEPFVDLYDTYEKEKEEKRIFEYPYQKNIFSIIVSDEELEKLKEKYSRDILYLTESLMFYISQDLMYGLSGWGLVAEDEYIKLSNYPDIVTGEFIGKKKTQRVLKKVKKQAIENLKNIYK